MVARLFPPNKPLALTQKWEFSLVYNKSPQKARGVFKRTKRTPQHQPVQPDQTTDQSPDAGRAPPAPINRAASTTKHPSIPANRLSENQNSPRQNALFLLKSSHE